VSQRLKAGHLAEPPEMAVAGVDEGRANHANVSVVHLCDWPTVVQQSPSLKRAAEVYNDTLVTSAIRWPLSLCCFSLPFVRDAGLALVIAQRRNRNALAHCGDQSK
jgi:hypothetical protein